MTKKDPQIQENSDREAAKGQYRAEIDAADDKSKDEVTNESDRIKNANAAGLGAIGRNDQMQTGRTSSTGNAYEVSY